MELRLPPLEPLFQSKGDIDIYIDEGISYFERNGVQVKGSVSAKKYYGTALTPPGEALPWMGRRPNMTSISSAIRR